MNLLPKEKPRKLGTGKAIATAAVLVLAVAATALIAGLGYAATRNCPNQFGSQEAQATSNSIALQWPGRNTIQGCTDGSCYGGSPETYGYEVRYKKAGSNQTTVKFVMPIWLPWIENNGYVVAVCQANPVQASLYPLEPSTTYQIEVWWIVSHWHPVSLYRGCQYHCYHGHGDKALEKVWSLTLKTKASSGGQPPIGGCGKGKPCPSAAPAPRITDAFAISVYDLQGRPVLDQFVAKGVYIYVVSIRAGDGRVRRVIQKVVLANGAARET